MSYYTAEHTEAYEQAERDQYDRKNTPGMQRCVCKWQKIYEVQWRTNDAGNVYWWAKILSELTCSKYGLGCTFPKWTTAMYYSSATDRGGYRLIIDKCDVCDCKNGPENQSESDYILDTTPPWERGYVSPKTLPKSVKFMMDQQQSGSPDHDAIKAQLIADLVVNGEHDEPSDSEMKSMCKGETSLNAV